MRKITELTTENAVVELRQYTLKPGRRDELIDVFERNFIEAQEQAGARVIGHFRDLDDPDRFVWLRGFPGMPSRRDALEAFYTSEVWYANRDLVNRLIVDSENVLLLRPAGRTSGFENGNGAQSGDVDESEVIFVATIWPLRQPMPVETVSVFAEKALEALGEDGLTFAALLMTEPSANNYPRLAIREGENVLVWFVRFGNAAAYNAHATRLSRLNESPRWRELLNQLGCRDGSQQVLRLAPATLSRLA